MASLKRRGKKYYTQYYVGTQQKRISLDTTSLQVAKEKLRQVESNLARGETALLPTKTPLPEILNRYVKHIRIVKTSKSAQTDIYYLRQMFGPICPALEITSRKVSPKTMKRPPKPGQDRRFKLSIIEVNHLEEITASDVAGFISAHVRSRGLKPKTANRYREIVCRLFNWAMHEGGVKMPGDKNSAAAVSRYKEHASKIRFLTLAQIDEQLEALQDNPQLQTMVAMYIYTGLRREEALWLTLEDVDLNAGANGMIRIQAKTVNGQFWQPKTKRNRAVPISSTLRTYLGRYTPRPSIGGWYFPSPKGMHYDPDNFSNDLREINTKAGLEWACLDFRHTFGSHLAMKGVSLYKISALMGNSPEICRRHYAALIPEAMADSVEFTPEKSLQPRKTNIRLVGGI